MSRLNYHHLHSFWAVAKEGNLTRAATRLHVSQSVLSTQIKLLEGQLGQALFTREGRVLRLTEAGRLALSYAEGIFTTGNELLTRLGTHNLDLVLSNRRVHGDADHPWRCRRIARQPVSLVGRPRQGNEAFRFPAELAERPLLLPGRDSDIRAAFDLLCEQLGLHYQALAEVDDMAMLRLLARDSAGVALLPTVVVQDELRGGLLEEYCVVPHLYENFYAITVKRHFASPLLQTLLKRPEADVLGVAPSNSP